MNEKETVLEQENQEVQETEIQELSGDAQKVEEMQKLIEQMAAKGDELLLDLKRERADFENYRRRNQLAVSEAFANGRGETVEALLPVMDNFERAIENADENDGFAKGIVMVYRQLKGIFEGMGLSEIEAQGKEFDPNLHNAAMQEEAEGVEPNVVLDVFNKGYMMGEKVLRHAVVKVSS